MSTALAIRGHAGAKVPTSKNKLVKAYLSSKRALAMSKEKAKETVEGVVQGLEIAGAAFALGGYQGMRAGEGKAPAKLFGKVNLELGVAAGLHVASLLGLAGDYSSHLRNFGNGALAAYATNWGRGIGYKWAKEKADKGGTSGSIEDQVADFLR